MALVYDIKALGNKVFFQLIECNNLGFTGATDSNTLSTFTASNGFRVHGNSASGDRVAIDHCKRSINLMKLNNNVSTLSSEEVLDDPNPYYVCKESIVVVDVKDKEKALYLVDEINTALEEFVFNNGFKKDKRISEVGKQVDVSGTYSS